ncbi:MAG: 1-(5-phosphoribosyl)-5-[(5-phosphoribosylamino)methylideneamino]imidazole-4-carboxamide isomerase [Verrucomicrobia bacterium]|nr:1-(5-phosphoribosyl)-5-[(5-phosphoribosylamino)methylideneamino]imidazole-4-carboxamide isomerase [Verrucomicrobiota bacterium]
MLLIPAIDLMDGKCVRLLQGRAGTETVYSDDPVSTAKRWEGEGARMLHVVDLDGAFEGRPVNFDAVCAIVEAVSIPVEFGGGIRDEATLGAVLATPLRRAILGTKACEAAFLRAAVAEHGDRIAVGIDARDGLVTVKGWQEFTALDAPAFARHVEALGVRTVIFTDVAADGTLEGPRTASLEAVLRAVSCDVIASGGVGSLDDIRLLQRYERDGLAGLIIGKALYTGDITLREALEVAG